MSEINMQNLIADLDKTIHEHGYENLYYVLFDEDSNLPWAIHLFYRDGEFMINGRDDSSYIIGNTIKFDNFEDAKTSFISKLEHFVESTKKGIKVGFSPYYSSPLWDDAE